MCKQDTQACKRHLRWHMPGGIGVQENPTSERSHICYARNFQCLKGRMLRSGSHVSKISNLSKTMLPTYILNINSDGTSVAWVTENLWKVSNNAPSLQLEGLQLPSSLPRAVYGLGRHRIRYLGGQVKYRNGRESACFSKRFASNFYVCPIRESGPNRQERVGRKKPEMGIFRHINHPTERVHFVFCFGKHSNCCAHRNSLFWGAHFIFFVKSLMIEASSGWHPSPFYHRISYPI